MVDRRRYPPTHYIPGLVWLTRKQWDRLIVRLDSCVAPETDDSAELMAQVKAARVDALRSHALMVNGRARQRYHDRVTDMLVQSNGGLQNDAARSSLAANRLRRSNDAQEKIQA